MMATGPSRARSGFQRNSPGFSLLVSCATANGANTPTAPPKAPTRTLRRFTVIRIRSPARARCLPVASGPCAVADQEIVIRVFGDAPPQILIVAERQHRVPDFLEVG